MIGESKNEITITNDRPGFEILLKDLATFSEHPQIIFEATGVYSRRLQTFLDDYGYAYVVLNPLKAKKEMDLGLRHNKTDKTDAYNLALIQKFHHHPLTRTQSEIYKKLGALSHFYEQLTADLVMAKNRLHQGLQSTFPEIESLFSTASGYNYWKILEKYPHCELIRQANEKDILNELLELKGFAIKRAQTTIHNLKELANKAYPVVTCNSVKVEQVKYYFSKTPKIK